MSAVLAYLAARSLPGGPSIAEDGSPAPALRPRLPSRYETAPVEKPGPAAGFLIEEDTPEAEPARRSPVARAREPDQVEAPAPPPPSSPQASPRRERPPATKPAEPVRAEPRASAPLPESPRVTSPESPTRPIPHARDARAEAPDGTARRTGGPPPPPQASHSRGDPTGEAARPLAPARARKEPPAAETIHPALPRAEPPRGILPVAQPVIVESPPPRAPILGPVGPRPVPMPPPRDAAATSAAPKPRVQVTIGRLEIRAAPAPVPEKRAVPRAPSMSLDDYLTRRGTS